MKFSLKSAALAAAAATSLVAAMFGPAGVAEARPPLCPGTIQGVTCTVTVTTTLGNNASNTITVPANVPVVHVTAIGGKGNNTIGATGGRAAELKFDVATSGGEQITANVHGLGSNMWGSCANGDLIAAGAVAVVRSTGWAVYAGGGGSAGCQGMNSDATYGGNGGDAGLISNSTPATVGGDSVGGGKGGSPATTSAGGGVGKSAFDTYFTPVGNGGAYSDLNTYPGGGYENSGTPAGSGGGGYYGGGAGGRGSRVAGAGGGGGGSSYIAGSAPKLVRERLVSPANATSKVIFSYPMSSVPPTIYGTVADGQYLYAESGIWPAGNDITYQWLRNGVAISGATSDTYQVSLASDASSNLAVAITGTLPGASAKVKFTNTVKVALGSLTNTPFPTITGDQYVGDTLTANTIGWDGGVSFSYRWLRNGTPIAGATSSTYDLVDADAGKAVTVRVAGSKPGYRTIERQSSTRIVQALRPLTAAVPSILGTAKVGNVLTIDAGTWTTGADLAYVWYRNGSPIDGATDSSYTLVSSDYRTRITVKVTGSKAGYTTASKTAAISGLVSR